ncbi:MAG: cytochrome c3 family protein [bacterium JZ-2024 1]
MRGRTVSVLGILLIIGVIGFFWRSEGKNQPIQYNHKKHIQMGLECSFCHQGLVSNSIRAGRPREQTCATCHSPEAPITQSAEEKKLLEYLRKNEPIPWVQVHRVPDFVFFSHRRHYTIGKIPCQTCHGKMEERTKPPEKPFVALKMDWCISCHRQKGVSTDCNACHR